MPTVFLLRYFSLNTGFSFQRRSLAILTHEPIDTGRRDHSWKNLVADAVAESSPKKLQEKIAVAEAAIFERSQALAANSHPQSAEVRELREASATLLALKTNVLKFPDWRPQQ
jgi:hypothetical protein